MFHQLSEKDTWLFCVCVCVCVCVCCVAVNIDLPMCVVSLFVTHTHPLPSPSAVQNILYVSIQSPVSLVQDLMKMAAPLR